MESDSQEARIPCSIASSKIYYIIYYSYFHLHQRPNTFRVSNTETLFGWVVHVELNH